MLPTSGVPNNAVDGSSFAYVGAFKKTTDTDFAITPTQMGARVYVAELGRFLQTDPIEGGTDNDYAYVNDPVNNYDLNGQWGFGDIFKAIKNAIKAVVRIVKTVVVPAVKRAVSKVSRIVNSLRPAVTFYASWLRGNTKSVKINATKVRWSVDSSKLKNSKTPKKRETVTIKHVAAYAEGDAKEAIGGASGTFRPDNGYSASLTN